MKNLLAVICLLGLGLSAVAQTSPAPKKPASTAKKPAAASTAKKPAAPGSAAPALTTQKQKASYAMGITLGSNLKRQEVDVDVEALTAGFRDVLYGKPPRISDAEAQAALDQLSQEMRAHMVERVKAMSEKNQKEGEAFLAANKTKEGVVTLPSGLQYKVLTPGTGPKPTANDTVVCNYKGTLLNGTEFDSSYKRGEPTSFPVSGVIKGWTEALQLMPVGSKWQLFIPGNLAYGERGQAPTIEPNSTLVFEVELLSIKPKEEKPAATPAPNPAEKK
ncbi:MAG TPA: FKBP-type peptidyl-prolyl cis-trans isomerase [Terriglobales bacterium]|nr:FKBP-type peptidyl-prolyl cis-trans isomerase [Terriglobales bacterium]